MILKLFPILLSLVKQGPIMPFIHLEKYQNFMLTLLCFMLVVILSGCLPVLQEQFIFMVESVLH